MFETGVGEDAPLACGEPVIAVELAHDFHHQVDRPEVAPDMAL